MSLYQTRELYVFLQLKLICFALLELSGVRSVLLKPLRVNANATQLSISLIIVQFFVQDNKAR